MFARVVCPACQHKFTIPEGDMGKRQTCPNCKTPFLAGRFGAEADVPMKLQPAEAAAMAKTMLVETEPPIRYNCPRCKKALESPAIEAGVKKPCPECGQRMQVPAAPPPQTPQPDLNKTILAADESNAPAPSKPKPAVAPGLDKTMLAATDPPITFNCPRCKKPLEAPAIEAGIKKPCPECGQRLQVPMASVSAKVNLNKTILAVDESTARLAGGKNEQAAATTTVPATSGAAPTSPSSAPLVSKRTLAIAGSVAGGLVLLLLLTCLVGMFSGNSEREKFAKAQQAQKEEFEKAKNEFAKAQKDFEKSQKDLEDQKKAIEQKERLMIELKQAELHGQKVLAELLAAQQRARDALEDKIQRDNVAYQNNKDLLAAAQEKARKEQAEIARKEKQALIDKTARDLEIQTKLAALKNDLDAANQRAEEARRNAQQATVVISQPQPVFIPQPVPQWPLWHPNRYNPFFYGY